MAMDVLISSLDSLEWAGTGVRSIHGGLAVRRFRHFSYR
jgi:hypothetical protein